jgi:hypothetical protein
MSSITNNNNNLFKYLLIPADSSVAIETKTADKAGGLENDELALSAKTYFYERSGAAKKALLLQQASPEQRSQLAQRWRDQQSASTTTQQNKQMQMTAQKLSDEQILSLLESQQASPSCEIMALTVPTKGNAFQAVSMYLSQEPQPAYNKRASQLLQACGHALPEQEGTGKSAGIYGDAFVGRCHDDEQGDEWLRVDFTEADLDANSSNWMTVAKASGGGGGSGSSNVSSLTGTLSQMGYQPTPEQQADGYKWEQTNDQVELKFVVPAGTHAKQCQVKFQRSSLRVQVHGETLVEGSTGGSCVVDDCTYTLQDEGSSRPNSDSHRELCVVLEKSEPGVVWAHAVQSKV